MTAMTEPRQPRTCEHPIAAVRWDKHKAVLRCTACGRIVTMDGL